MLKNYRLIKKYLKLKYQNYFFYKIYLNKIIKIKILNNNYFLIIK